jgi:N-acyl-D-amino-acid deacylase
LITNATVVDGTGTPAGTLAVRIRADRITEVGALDAQANEVVVDAGGLVLAPGFIDTHSHHDRGLLQNPDANAVVSQGVTTIVVGQDGGSRWPLSEFFTQLTDDPVAVNVASYVGHGTIRRRVMGDDFRRPATEAEVREMQRLLRIEMAAGALGLSTGLEYDPGIYSETEEVLALARETASLGGRYMSHMRSEDRYLWQAVEEIIRIGREAEIPVQISHMKIAMRSFWGSAPRLIARLNEARASGVEISADVYPYEYWQSTMTVLFPERDFDNRQTATFALTELTTPEGMLIARFDPDPTYVGKTLAQLADLRESDPVTTYMELIAESQAVGRRDEGSGESIIATSMDTADIGELIAWDHANVCSDGGLAGRHPRGFGAFTRVLRQYVRQEARLPLEEAVRKMSGLAAEHIGLSDRGVIRPGAYADLVLFDIERVADRATPENPQEASTGIERVWVNGVEVFSGGTTTGRHPGTVIRRPD